MSIFDSLKNAIFGSHAQAAAPQASRPPPQAGAAAQPSATAAAPGVQAGAQSPSKPAQAPTQADVEAVLSQKAAQKGEKLNWRSSIVDLMKLVDLDPSLENRKTLAKELGFTGNTQDSATMNVWLHHEVMNKLAASGGKVPDNLRH